VIIGIDYASVDGNLPPDFAKLNTACVAAGSRLGFAIMRAAWGTSPDPTIARDWRAASDAGLTCGGYLYLRMPHPGFTATPEDQVHVAADVLGTLTDRSLVPIIDVEDTGLSARAELEWVHRAWLEVESIYGVPPIIYDSARVWEEDLNNLPAGDMLDSPQWVAKPWPWAVRTLPQLSAHEFATERPGRTPIVPAPWGPGNWWMHQYQGDATRVPGFSGTVDLSRFRLMTAGERGPRVAWVMRRILQVGPQVAVSDVFDTNMTRLVKDFQLVNFLTVDGIIGPRTFAALTWRRVPPLRAA
jgi:GH25 family lysozyme M1 (1,4-beta-N-acetylmuramidase)